MGAFDGLLGTFHQRGGQACGAQHLGQQGAGALTHGAKVGLLLGKRRQLLGEARPVPQLLLGIQLLEGVFQCLQAREQRGVILGLHDQVAQAVRFGEQALYLALLIDQRRRRGVELSETVIAAQSVEAGQRGQQQQTQRLPAAPAGKYACQPSCSAGSGRILAGGIRRQWQLRQPQAHAQPGAEQAECREHAHLAQAGHRRQGDGQIGGEAGAKAQCQARPQRGESAATVCRRQAAHAFQMQHVIDGDADQAGAEGQRQHVQAAEGPPGQRQREQHARGHRYQQQRQPSRGAEHRPQQQQHADQRAEPDGRHLLSGLLRPGTGMEDQPGAQQPDVGIVGLHAIHGLFQRLLIPHRVGAAGKGGANQTVTVARLLTA